MKNLIIVLALILGAKETSQAQTRKILFLGNSYTYANDLPQIISNLASNTGDVLIYESNLHGGYTLRDHFGSAVSRNKILSNDWDYIVLQEQSQTPTFPVPSTFFNSFLQLKGFIKQNKPCAQITSFMTWGHQNGDIQNCANNPSVCTYSGMQNLLNERYMSVSNLNNAEVTPVGEVWKYIRNNNPTIQLYQPDGSHPSLAGSYLAACCFYTSILRKDPTLITNNYGLDSNIASIIRSATKNIIFDQMPNWYIGKYVPTSNFNYTIGNGTNEVVLNGNLLEPQHKDHFLWDFGDGTTSTTLNPTHNYSSNGSYTIKLTSYKCFLGQDIITDFERTVNFCAQTNTIFPDLILCQGEIGTIWTQTADSYQWLDYLGNPIIGETNQSIQVTSGEYSVLTTINGCIERSPQKFVDGWINNSDCNPLGVVGIEKPLIISVFPNPTDNILNIKSSKSIIKVSIFDILGNQIMLKKGYNITNVDITNFSQGIYLLKVFTESNNSNILKFVKN